MSVSDIDFVAYMPNLQYLILTHTKVRNIEPLRNCKNLKFLELEYAAIFDFSPLQECTALEDLNIGKTYADIEPLKELTWLKNLWMIYRADDAYEMSLALPNTHIVCSGNGRTCDNGWRFLQNYYDMRDVLKMYYMS